MRDQKTTELEVLRAINDMTVPSDLYPYMSDQYPPSVRRSAKLRASSLLRRQSIPEREVSLTALMGILENECWTNRTWYRRNIVELIVGLSFSACLRKRLLDYLDSHESSRYILENTAITSLLNRERLKRDVAICRIQTGCDQPLCSVATSLGIASPPLAVEWGATGKSASKTEACGGLLGASAEC